ncbi:MAG: metallophosphoesterase [Prolixibacteraceae bacterium]|jgi:hypothetical protein|nr:metallophosphoesterase [Prolixibacteraceae bacterium]NLX28810.1 metallophosphoesterase [Bacteroidales bacterium]HNQ37147.1 metallophosphoesterase [Prolixibacteraceae bacterium]HOY52713.1 metallophosphoesterase [Prolixibacteraceae bacterium]HPJ77415.1 metallophosphoesterase [Prolixibacteraceae bacterium]
MYDIIGDVHGHATLLKNLLLSMGYVKSRSGYFHPERKAVFVGDFVNRGPEIRQSVELIRKMTEGGHALAVLGNHEINALLYHLKREKKASLLDKMGKRYQSVEETILQFKNFQEEWKSHRKWLRTLPLFLELDGLRVVHACWTTRNIQVLKEELAPGKLPKEVLRDLVLEPRSSLSQAILQTSRGIHLIMPADLRLYDNHRRHHHLFRVRWWKEPHGLTFQQLSFESKFRLPDYTIPGELLPETEPYAPDAPPVFFGHYCRGNGPFIIRKNICCVDACVTGKKRLAAYRWDGERHLDPEKLVFVK